ncbi:hypothetical protein CkaCkLH20_06653 [Colletotrichum karsti]|uniref:Uncharacterized protein n=1 Tax=Colletotrichum karsti TaxID=1095194 RepID=A0A9P6I846_9PEZI|nr:uncharacterized protein CkaCkLH20_06653 [Colletotrichum karsti]KAF9875721.1 hypothetical protein CkaCkLH20_06653 [Colletotrichum karsti]
MNIFFPPYTTFIGETPTPEGLMKGREYYLDPAFEKNADASTKKQRVDVEESSPDSVYSTGRRLRKNEFDGGYEHCIIIRLHYLRVTTVPSHLTDSPAPDADPRDMLKPWSELAEEYRALNTRPVEDGQVIRIWAKDPDHLPDWDILRLR